MARLVACARGAVLSPMRQSSKNKRLNCKRARALEVSAVYNPTFPAEDPMDEGALRLHGVLHSTKLPDMLSESVGVYDARDAIEACTGLWGEEKEQCYAIFGVDPAADIWFDTVFHLEQALELETDPEEEASHHGKERC